MAVKDKPTRLTFIRRVNIATKIKVVTVQELKFSGYTIHINSNFVYFMMEKGVESDAVETFRHSVHKLLV